jgi:hypothetical protein
LDQQWIGLTSVMLLASMVLSPFILTWVFCDRPEPFIRRCLRASIFSLIVIVLAGATLLLFYQPYFPEGEIAAKTRETGMQALLAAVIAPVFGTDFLMRIKISMRYWKSKGHHEL